jgi:quercetin dioxygenase-like cupin family protein
MGTEKDIFDKSLDYSMGNEDKPKYSLPKKDAEPSETNYGLDKSYGEKGKYPLSKPEDYDYGLDRKEQTSALDYPKITPTRNFHETLEVRTQEDLTTLYIDGVSIVSYSPFAREHFGKKVGLDKEDLAGELFFNTGFFRKFNLHRPMETESDMENIAKTFFKVNGDNYVALVQYLQEGGRSSEHHHTLEESIAQLAGRSYVELRPVEDDTDYRVVELSQGDILRIPPNNLHFVGTIEGGSLTIPIKQTLESQKDHLYLTKSDKRISLEVNRLLKVGYSSGNEAVSAIHDYYESLRFPQEKVTAMNLLSEKSDKDNNPNIRRILKEFSADYI